MCELLLIEIESHPPSSGIEQITVVAHPVPSRALQLSFFDKVRPSADRLSTLLPQLQVLMGDGRCGVPTLVDTHQPGAFEVRPFSLVSATVPSNTRTISDRKMFAVLCRFRVPLPVKVTVRHGDLIKVFMECLPFVRGKVRSSSGPWRSSGQWWLSYDSSSPSLSSWDQDEWDVELSDGGLYRIVRHRTSKKWFVEGFMD